MPPEQPEYGSMLDPLVDSLVALVMANIPAIIGLTVAYLLMQKVDAWLRGMAKEAKRRERARVRAEVDREAGAFGRKGYRW